MPSPAAASLSRKRPPRTQRLSLVPFRLSGSREVEYEVRSIFQLPTSGASHCCSGPGRLASMARAICSVITGAAGGACGAAAGGPAVVASLRMIGTVPADASSATADKPATPAVFTPMWPPAPTLAQADRGSRSRGAPRHVRRAVLSSSNPFGGR